MYTVKQMSEYLDISVSGLHLWIDKYQEFLGEDAVTPTKDGRLFNDTDVEIFWTTKALRDTNMPHDDIKAQLRGGYRSELPPYMPGELPNLPDMPRTEVQALRHEIATLNAEIIRLREENKEKDSKINKLQGKVEALQEALRDLFREGKDDTKSAQN